MRTEAHVKTETCAPPRGSHTEADDGHREGRGHEAGALPRAKATGDGQATAPREGRPPHGDGHRHGGKATTNAPGSRSGRPIPNARRPHGRGLTPNVDKSRRDGHRPRTKASARMHTTAAPMLTSPGTDLSAGPMLTMLTWGAA